MAKITAARLRELLEYDPLTGLWRRKRGDWFAGSINISGCRGHSQTPYRRFRVDGGRYYAHVLATLYMTGEYPKDQVDHRDLDGLNNIWANLRQATQSQNQANRPKDTVTPGAIWNANRRPKHDRAPAPRDAAQPGCHGCL